MALGHNAISLWRWKENEVLNTVHCEDKCILYPFKINYTIILTPTWDSNAKH